MCTEPNRTDSKRGFPLAPPRALLPVLDVAVSLDAEAGKLRLNLQLPRAAPRDVSRSLLDCVSGRRFASVLSSTFRSVNVIFSGEQRASIPAALLLLNPMSTALTVGGWFVKGFIQALLQKASDSSIWKVTSRRGLGADLKKLRGSLLRTHAILNKADMRPDEDPIVAEMMKELKDAAYDAEDLLDEFAYQDLKEKIEGEGGDQGSYFLSRAINTTTHLFNDAGARLRLVQGKLQDLADDMDKIMKLDDSGKATGTRLRSRETSSFLPELVFGRDEDREKIIQMLLGSAEQSSSSIRDNNGFSVIPLVGIGGIGKTTLAQFVYNDDRLQHYFQLKICVCVSGNFNAKTLTKEIIESVTKREQSDQMKLDSLQKILKEKIASKRFLLVLDDVWDDNTEEWGKLFGPLKFGAPESKVIVTTRSMNVAASVDTVKTAFVDGLEEAA
ncbi:hypothetical protein ZIOFF_064212 [Zingiber officinale]|uniref:Disease resistance RPP13-like protein 1 n=1 Tax=Zingiber officinale TaxID=94328 RepID=A0A8J5ES66_ZINOF|nr:hypothetical protein ZIOFF_064212 [Zingiber officinale]